MSRWRLLAAVPVVVALGGGGWYAYKTLDERHERRRFLSELVCCLTGADPVTPAEATAAAGRMFAHVEGHLGACEDELERASHRDLASLSPELPDRIATVLEGKPEEHIPHLESLYSALGKLGIEASDGCSARPLKTEVTNVSAARERMGKVLWPPNDGQRFPPHRMIFVGSKPRLALEASTSGEALAHARWTDEPFVSHWPARVKGDGTLERGDAQLPFDGHGPKPFVATAKWMLARDGKTLVGRRLVDGEAMVDEAAQTVTLPRKLNAVKVQSCARPDGDLLALVGDGVVAHHGAVIVEATDELRVWGHFDPGRVPTGGARSGPSLICDEHSITLTWATSEPTLKGTFPPRAVKDANIPPGPHPQVVSRIRCSSSGCAAPREQRLDDLPMTWRSMGGWSSPMYLTAVDVEPLADDVLLWWSRGRGLYVRIGEVGALDGVPVRRIVDLAYPQGEEPFVPEAVNFPAITSVARRGTAVVMLTEDKRSSEQPAASFLLRFEPSGKAGFLLPDAPPAKP